MQVYLEPIAPPGPLRPVVGVVTLGRALLGGVGASEAHALLDASGARCTLRDLGSTNGTLAGGVRLRSGETRVLADGNEIRLGDVRLIVRILATSPSPAEEPSPFGGQTAALARENLAPGAPASPLPGGEPVVVDFSGPMVLVAHQGLPARGLVLGDGAVHTVGREGDLAIDDATVSTAHAEIRRYGLQVLIRDVGSKHGLQIGGQPVEPRAWHAWRHGAVVSLGRAVLVLTGIPAPPPRPAPALQDPTPAPPAPLELPPPAPRPQEPRPQELPPPGAPNWQAFSQAAARRAALHALPLGDPDGPTHIKPRADHRLLVILGALAALAALLGAAGLVLYRFTR